MRVLLITLFLMTSLFASYERALVCIKDQEEDKAFQYFLSALESLPEKLAPQISTEEQKIYTQALKDYLDGAGKDPKKVANQLLEMYLSIANNHKDWLQLNFLVAAMHANAGQMEDFFIKFYAAFPYFKNSYLSYKTRGILYLRLSKNSRFEEERKNFAKEAFSYLATALEKNKKDGNLYKVLIFLAKNEKNDGLVLNYLEKMVEARAPIARSDIYRYVKQAVDLEEIDLGQKIVDLAGAQYDFSRSISKAQNYLNQCRG